LDLNFEETGIIELSFAMKCLSAFACKPLDGRGSSLAAKRNYAGFFLLFFSFKKWLVTAWEYNLLPMENKNILLILLSHLTQENRILTDNLNLTHF